MRRRITHMGYARGICCGIKGGLIVGTMLLSCKFASLAGMRFRLLFLVPIVVTSIVLAQSFTPVREQKNLTPEALAKLHTLETLDSLPAVEWRFHAGDIPHGESVGWMTQPGRR